MIASVTVSATTISNKLIEKRKTSYKSDVIYQKSFATEDGKLLEYNRNPAKKCVPYPHLKTLLSTSHTNSLEELTLLSWGWEQREATVPETQGRKCLPQKRLDCFHCWCPSTSIVWAGDSGVAAPGIGWSQMVPLLKGKHFHCLRWQGETGDCRTTAKNLALTANPFVIRKSSVSKNIYLLYYVWPHPIKLLTTI